MKLRSMLMHHSMTQSTNWDKEGLFILLGSIYITLLSQVEIPSTPIPVTLQTFAIFSLALFQGSRKSCLSLLLYLVAATMGLPVFPSACADPLWLLHPSAGYCLSFPLAAYLVGRFAELKSSIGTALGLCCGQGVVYLLGVSWLSMSIGWQQALGVGFYPFILLDVIKLLAAFSMKMVMNSRK